MNNIEIGDCMARRSFCSVDPLAYNKLEVYRYAISELFTKDEFRHDERQQILTSLLVNEKLGNFSLKDGFSMPHLVLDLHDKPSNRVGWLLSKKQMTDDAAQGDLAHVWLFVFGDEVFVRQMCGVGVELYNSKEFLSAARSASTPSELRTHILHGIETVVGTSVPNPSSDGVEEYSYTEVQVPPQGLHARPVERLARLAMCFECDISVTYRNRTADSKSMFALMVLGAEGGATVKIEAKGRNATQAVLILEEFIDLRFPETGGYTVVKATYDVGWGHALYIRGNVPPLSWSRGIRMNYSGDNCWSWVSTDISINHSFEFKTLIDDEHWEQIKSDNPYAAHLAVGGESTRSNPQF